MGEFKNDNKDGNGTIIRCSGADAGYKYVGQMKNDKIHGQGTYTSTNMYLAMVDCFILQWQRIKDQMKNMPVHYIF